MSAARAWPVVFVSLAGELHVDPLQGRADPGSSGRRIGPGTWAGARRLPAAIRSAGTLSHSHAPAVVHAGRKSHAAVDHRPVRELTDRHRDRLHRADAVPLVVVIDGARLACTDLSRATTRAVVALGPP